jgi:hypothetical protein
MKVILSVVGLILVSAAEGEYVIAARNVYVRDWLASRMTDTFVKVIEKVVDRGSVTVRFVVANDEDDEHDHQMLMKSTFNGVRPSIRGSYEL